MISIFRSHSHFSSCSFSVSTPARARLHPLALACSLLLAALPLGAQERAQQTVQENAAADSARKALPEIEAAADAPAQRTPGAITTIEGEALERAASMADVVRYQPLVSAPGAVSGGTRQRSEHERAGTSGYNIRGVENNRIGLDVDGVELPEGINRPHNPRTGIGTLGIGRDYIDPDLYIGADIHSGTTTARRSAGGIGGAVSFRTKSAADYLAGDNTAYTGAKAGHNTTDRSWHESITAAARSGPWDGLLAYSRRDGHQARNNSSIKDYPQDWHSNALLLKGGFAPHASQRVQLSAELYRRKNANAFDGWDSDGANITSLHRQKSNTARDAVQLQHAYTPSGLWLERLDTRLTYQRTKTLDDTVSTTLATGDPRRIESGYETRTLGFSSSADTRVNLQHLGLHRIGFGVSASHEDTERPWQLTDNRPPYPGTGVPPMMRSQPDTKARRWGVFVEDEIAWPIANDGRRFALVPGLRVDRVQLRPVNFASFASDLRSPQDMERVYGGQRANTLVSPSLSVVYDLQARFSAYAQVKRGARAPTAGELFGSWALNGNRLAAVGNPEVKKETSTAFDVGLKGSPMPGVAFNSSLFYTQYKGFIAYKRYPRGLYPEMFTNIPDDISLIYRPENRDRAKIYGFELGARLHHGQWSRALRGVHSSWALGLNKGSSRSDFPGDKNKPLDSILPRKAVLGLGWDAPAGRWGLQLTGIFTAARRATPNTRETYDNEGTEIIDTTTVELFRVPGSAVFDFSGYWQIAQGTRLNFGITNLFDRRYWDYASARRIQPGEARDRRDIELLTRPGRSLAVNLSMAF